MKKKALAIVLALVMGAALAACGEDASMNDLGKDRALYTYEWTCPSCGTQNVTKNVEPLVTCEKCGERRNLEMASWDCDCGKKNNQWYDCAACGKERPEEK